MRDMSPSFSSKFRWRNFPALRRLGGISALDANPGELRLDAVDGDVEAARTGIRPFKKFPFGRSPRRWDDRETSRIRDSTRRRAPQ